MSPKKFTPGDRVQLKSNGPVMVVSEFDTGFKEYNCVWFADGKPTFALFKEETLQLAE